MSRNLVSFLFALLLSAGIASCEAELAFAQETGTMPPPQTSFEGTDSRVMLPPPHYQGGNLESQRMMPPPSENGGDFRQPEMMGQPPQQTGTARYDGNYQNRYQQGGQMRPTNQPPSSEGKQGTTVGQRPLGEQKNMRPPQGQTDFGGQAGDRNQQSFGAQKGSEDENSGMGGQSDEKMAEQQKKMQTQQLAQMKRGMVSGIEQGLKQIKRQVEVLSKKGITIPSEVAPLVTELSSALQTVKSATELTDDVESAFEVLQEKGQDLREIGQKLGTLDQMSQMTKQVEKEFAKMDKEVSKARKSKEAVQYPDVISKIESQLASLKTAWEETKTSLTSGDSEPGDVQEAMEEIFSDIREVRQSLGMLKQLGSVSKMIASAGKELTKFEKEVARQKKAGKDVGELASLLSKAKGKLTEITVLSKQSGFDPEDLFDGMQELEHIRSEMLQELDNVSGKSDSEKLGASVMRALQSKR